LEDAMRKAVMLDVRLWVEGDAEPASDFAAAAAAAVRDILKQGAESHPELTVKVRQVKERGV
jgi:hypothetical protein